MHDNRAALAGFRRHIFRQLPEASALEFTFDEVAGPKTTRMLMRLDRAEAGPRGAARDRADPGDGPVRACRAGDAGRSDHRGIVVSCAEGLRWALARIRERPAYARLRERAREIERLKTEF